MHHSKPRWISSKICLLILIVILGFLPASAQSDSKQVLDQYDPEFKVDAKLVSGDYYQTPVMSTATGHPFYIDPNWKIGSVFIEGTLFENIPIRYDVSSHKVVLSSIQFTDTYLQLALRKDRIEYFTMAGKKFVPFPAPPGMQGPVFYEVLVQGKTNLLQFVSKNLKVTAGGASDYSYQKLSHRYLQIDGKLVKYKGKKSLYKAFQVLKAELKSIIKEHHWKLWLKSGDDHIQLVRACNSLLTQTQ